MAKYKKRIILGVLALLLVLAMVSNYGINKIIKNMVHDELEKRNAKHEQLWSIEDVDANIFEGNLLIKSIKIQPDSAYFDRFTKGEVGKSNLLELKVSDIELKGLKLYDILFNRSIKIEKIYIEGLDLSLYKLPAEAVNMPKESKTRPNLLDSIHIPGINSIDLNKFLVDRTTFKVLDALKKDTLDVYEGKFMEIDGVSFESMGNGQDIFKINTDSLKVRLQKQKIEFDKVQYAVYFDTLDLFVNSGKMALKGLKYTPMPDKYEMASSFTKRKEVYDLNIPFLNIYGLRLEQMLDDGVFEIDSLLADSFKLAINVDVALPRDPARRPKFPHIAIKTATTPIAIGKIILTNGSLLYEELEGVKQNVIAVNIDDIHLEASNILTPHYNPGTGDEFAIKMSGNLLKSLDFNILLNFPYHTSQFSFSGNIGSFPLIELNPVLLPLAGIKFTKGRANGIVFNSRCNTASCSGEMTMLYNDLQIEIEKNNDNKKNKKMTLLANTIIHQDNPKNGKTKTVPVAHEQTANFGMVHLMLGTLISGMKNTLGPQKGK